MKISDENLIISIILIILVLIIGMTISFNFSSIKSDINDLTFAVEEIDDDIFDLRIDYLSNIKVNTDLTYDRLIDLKYELKENRKKDIAYQNKLVDVKNYNILYFNKLLKQIKKDARLNSWKERKRVDTLRVDINDLTNLLLRFSEKINIAK